MHAAGLEAVYLANRDKLLRFLRARGAGEAAEDLLQELWIRVSTQQRGPVASPLAYLHSAANTLMIDRYRSERQAQRRAHDWTEVTGTHGEASEQPSADRVVAARQQAALVEAALQGLPHRAAAIFRRHRIDGIGQRQVAAEFAVSISTVEGDLRSAYRALAAVREQFDEA